MKRLPVVINHNDKARHSSRRLNLMDNELFLDKQHGKLGGVCAGVARYLDMPRFWVRVAAVAGLFIHAPSVLLAYGLAFMILEDRPGEYDL